MAKKPDVSTTAEGEDDLSDATVEEMEKGAATGAAEKTRKARVEKIKPEVRGEHVPHANFREAVHQSPVTRTDEDLGIGPRDPYPTGNPRPQEDIDQEVRGVPVRKPEDNAHG